MDPAASGSVLQTMALIVGLILTGAPSSLAQDVERLRQKTAVIREMDEATLIALVPLQSGLQYIGCPHCTAGHQERQLVWSIERPDEVACRHCGHRFPSEQYPMKEALIVHTPRGENARFDYWADDKGYRYFFKARRDDEVRKYLADQTLALARLYSATNDKAHARRAAVILDRFAQVFPDWCYHYDYPFRQKEIYDGDVPPEKFRSGFRTARWSWWAYLDIPDELVEAYQLIRESGVLEELSKEQNLDVATRIRNDLLRNAGEQVLANADDFTNMSPSAWRSLVKLGRTLEEPRYVHEVVRRFRKLVERQFFYDGMWCEGAPSYGAQTVSSLETVLRELRGYSDPPGFIDPMDATRFDNLDLKKDFPLLEQARSALARLRLPNGREVPVHDTWSTPGRSHPVEPGPSYFLPALGHACLRNGDGPNRSEFHLSWSGGYGHQHADILSLILFANGRELFSDLGYTHTAYRSWTLATAAHNTVVIDGVSQNSGSQSSPTDGSLRFIDTTNPRVQVVSADGVRAYPGLAKVYRRTLVVIETGEQSRYAIDVFEVHGGQTHDYFLHGDADRPTQAFADQELHELPTLLPQGYSWKPTTNEGQTGRVFETHYAYGFLRQLKTAVVKSAVQIDWQAIDDSQTGLRTTLLPESNSELVLGENPSIRLAREDDSQLDRYQRPFVMLRHRDDDGRSTFVSVLEPYGTRPIISAAKRIDLGDGAVGLQVTRGEHTDLIVIGAATDKSMAAGPVEAHFRGNVGVLTLSGDAVEQAYALGEGGWRAGNFELKSSVAQQASLLRAEPKALIISGDGVMLPPSGTVVRLMTDDGWVYPYHVKSASLLEGERVLRVDIAEGPGFDFDAGKQKLHFRSFPQREHSGAVRVEWLTGHSFPATSIPSTPQ